MTVDIWRVLVDGETGLIVCPWHGAQPQADWRDGVAPCGCFFSQARGRMWATRPKPAEGGENLPTNAHSSR